MEGMSFLWFLLIGLVAGWLGNLIMKGSGQGLIINLICGILGGLLGGWLFSLFHINTSGIWGSLLTALVGAIILIWIVGMIFGKHIKKA